MSDESQQPPQVPDETHGQPTPDQPTEPLTPPQGPSAPQDGRVFRLSRVEFGFHPEADSGGPPSPYAHYRDHVAAGGRIVARVDSDATALFTEPQRHHLVEARVFFADLPHPAHGRLPLHATVTELKTLALRTFHCLNQFRVYTLRGLVAGGIEGATYHVDLDQMGSLHDAWLRMRDFPRPPMRWNGELSFELIENQDGAVKLADGSVKTRAEWMKLLREKFPVVAPQPS